MKRAIVLILASVIGQGCQQRPAATDEPLSEVANAANPARAHNTPPNELPPNELPASELRPAKPQAGEPSAEEIFQKLTANSWTSLPPNRPVFPPMDYSVASYRADGTWSFEFHTDYHIPAQTGKWNLQLVQDQWYLCRDDGARQRIGLNDDGTLAFGKTFPHEPLARDPKQTAAALPPLVLKAEVQEIVKRLTAHTWKRANDMDLFMEPTQVRFRPDWTYVASYRGGECKSEGMWYAKTDEIVAHSPKGRCDRPSDKSTGDWLTAQVIDDRKILVNWDLYVPEDEAVPRGIIWKLFGFDATDIRIEYDMPIRAGVPVRFDVTITNRSTEPLLLERFSLTRGYSDYGRGLGERGKELVLPDDEIVGHDLGRDALGVGKSQKFQLTATFPEAGAEAFYFNSMISGSTQNWDIHQAHWPSVAAGR